MDPDGSKLFYGHFGWLVLWFVMRERQVSMFYHVLKENFHLKAITKLDNETHPNLSLHCYTEECDEVHHEYGPEDRNIENVEEGTAKSDGSRLHDRVPKFKLRKSSDEGSEFLIASRWEGWTVGVVC